MRIRKVLIGIDIGTTNVKSAALDAEGGILGNVIPHPKCTTFNKFSAAPLYH